MNFENKCLTNIRIFDFHGTIISTSRYLYSFLDADKDEQVEIRRNMKNKQYLSRQIV